MNDSTTGQRERPGGRQRFTRSRRAGIPIVAAATLAFGAGQVALAAPGSAATAAVAAIGHAPAVPKDARAVAAPADTTALTLDVALNSPNAAGLAAYAGAVGDKNSASYHHYLAKGEVAKAFGADASTIAAVDNALKAAGLTPGKVSADGLFIPVTATVAQAKHAFGTDFAGYRVSGRTVYANTSAPKIAASVASDVSAVIGLDNLAYAVPHHTGGKHAVPAPAGRVASVTSQYAVPTCSNIDRVLNQDGLYNGQNYYTATALSNIYGLNSVLAGGDNGTGVTVAVLDLESYDPTGVSHIDGCYGSSASVSEVPVDGGPSAAANMYNNVGVESALDIENIATLAPGVSILDYAGPDGVNATDTNVLDTYGRIITDDRAQVVSTSWGLCEPFATSGYMQSENTLFQEAAVQGQTVVASAGDSGSSDCYHDDGTTTTISVDDPASQPYVISVGGTTMSGLTNPSQTTWNSSQYYNGVYYYGAGGGGVSSYVTAPAYQAGVAGPGYSAHCATASSTGCRQVPDVSALADPAMGYVIDEYYNDGTTYGYYYNLIGGTSGAAPVWAAHFALADASVPCVVHGQAGFASPALYQAGSAAFQDVTTGDNDISQIGAAYGFSAGTGYDMATGWGTPNASGVLAAVCAAGRVNTAAGYFQGIGPVRVLDTRDGTGGTTGPVAKNGTVKLQITGKNGVAPSNVTAAVLNVTVTSDPGAGVASVYPDGSPRPSASNLNWSAGETVPNLVVVPVGKDGAVDIWNGSPLAGVQFVADLTGYFTSDATVSGISTYKAVGPVRAMDTRDGTGVAKGQVGAKHSDVLPVGGTTINSVVIPTGITAVAMNVTVTNPTNAGFITVYPNETAAGAPNTVPSTSNVNFGTGETIPNMVIVPVGPDGKVDFYNGGVSGATDVIADLGGYFTAGTGGAKFHPIGPDRVLDTRSGLGAPTANPIAGKSALGLQIPADATAIVSNLTITQPKSAGFLSAYPDGVVTTSSNVNFAPGQDIPNLAIVPNNGQVDFYNWGTGSTHLIVDISGYFSAG